MEPDVCNEIIGGWPLKTALCNIYKEKTYRTNPGGFHYEN